MSESSKRRTRKKGHQWEFAFDVDVQWAQPTRGVEPTLFQDLPEHAAQFEDKFICPREFEELDESFRSCTMTPPIHSLERHEEETRQVTVQLGCEEMERIRLLQHEIRSLYGEGLTIDELVQLALRNLSPSSPEVTERFVAETVPERGISFSEDELLLIG